MVDKLDLTVLLKDLPEPTEAKVVMVETEEALEEVSEETEELPEIKEIQQLNWVWTIKTLRKEPLEASRARRYPSECLRMMAYIL